MRRAARAGILSRVTSTCAIRTGGSSVCAASGQEREYRKRGEVARIEKAQPALLQQEIASLAPQQKGHHGHLCPRHRRLVDQDVFGKEVDGGLDAIANVLPIKDRTVRLIKTATNGRYRAARRPCRISRPPCTPSATSWTRTRRARPLDDIARRPNGFALQLPGAMTRADAAGGRLDARQRRHQEPRRDRFGLLLGNIRSPACQRQHHRHHRGGREKHLVRLRAGTRLDLFRRCVFPAEPASRNAISASAFEHARVLIQGWELMDRAAAVQSAGLISGRRLVAQSSRRTSRRQSQAVTARPAIAGHATASSRPHALSEAHSPRSSRKRSTGADELMARTR